MTPDEIRIAIAECCNRNYYDLNCHPDNPCYDDCCESHSRMIEALPNYPASLDACAEFERTLTDEEHATYTCLLADMFNGTVPDIEELDGADKDNECRWSNYALSKAMRATPLQRCEAFLRVKGKWKEARP